MNESILKDRRGAVTLWVLGWLVLMIVVGATALSFARTEGTGNTDVRQAAESASKASILQGVTSDSQAYGVPRIDPDIAHMNFRMKLAANLGLDVGTLTPLQGSGLKRVEYVFFVYNGDSQFGLTPARRYSYDSAVGGIALSENLPASGFPHRIGISDTTIASESDFPEAPPVVVELPEPGVIALIAATTNPISGGGEGERSTRWVSARIHRNW